ncbi:MAG TPA: hypothetical protein VJ183_14150 [Chloroflexia bacterium]|nr:hypothetical protein [Chloroflexia bacterium]
MSTTQQDQTTEAEVDTTLSYERVRDNILRWPLSMRALLMHELLNMIVKEVGTPRPRGNTLTEALGLLANGQPPPTDEEVERLLDERRMEKYG